MFNLIPALINCRALLPKLIISNSVRILISNVNLIQVYMLFIRGGEWSLKNYTFCGISAKFHSSQHLCQSLDFFYKDKKALGLEKFTNCQPFHYKLVNLIDNK